MQGVEVNITREQYPTLMDVFDTFDNVLATIFTLEIALKWMDSFVAFWKSGWNIFDFLVTAMVMLCVFSYFVYWHILILILILIVCIVLYCIVLYCIVLYCIVLYCTVLYCIVLYLYCIVLCYIILYYITKKQQTCSIQSCKFCTHCSLIACDWAHIINDFSGFIIW